MTQKINNYIAVSYYKKSEYSKPYIMVKDLTDYYNEPTAFTRNIRGLEKAWSEVKDNFDKTWMFNNVLDIFDKYKLNYHSYCAVD